MYSRQEIYDAFRAYVGETSEVVVTLCAQHAHQLLQVENEKRQAALAAFEAHLKEAHGYPGGISDTGGGAPYYELDASVVDALVAALKDPT